MVMDVTPSPQCVGREFVRQYYTLLNEGPQYLHRFYSHNSSFIHGGVEHPGEEQAPVIGQSNIHKKIMALNFNDCHAKIRQVDAQATIGTGVVVQVTGELSNSGRPMRRFMQTFVLAPQTPNKYYVHNDIFRYQDEVFHDESEDEDNPSEMPVEAMPVEPAPEPFYPMSQPEPVAQPEPVVVAPSEPIVSNGVHEEHVPDYSEPAPEVPAPAPRVATPDPIPEAEPEPFQEVTETAVPAEPKSWANVVNKNAPSAVAAAPAAAPPPATTPPAPPTSFPSAGEPARVERPSANRPRPARAEGFGARPDLATKADDGSGNEGEPRRPPRPSYPDSQQVFVGNLPAQVIDFELRDFFKSFGGVIEVRINRNSNSKVPFGFVVFEDEASVQQVLLQKKNIEYKGHRLNVEEKKTRRTLSNSRPRRDGQRPRAPPARSFNQQREDSGNRDRPRDTNKPPPRRA